MNSQLALERGPRPRRPDCSADAGLDTECPDHPGISAACLGHVPRTEELELACCRFLTPETRESLAGFCLALLNINEFVYID